MNDIITNAIANENEEPDAKAKNRAATNSRVL